MMCSCMYLSSLTVITPSSFGISTAAFTPSLWPSILFSRTSLELWGLEWISAAMIPCVRRFLLSSQLSAREVHNSARYRNAPRRRVRKKTSTLRKGPRLTNLRCSVLILCTINDEYILDYYIWTFLIYNLPVIIIKYSY